MFKTVQLNFVTRQQRLVRRVQSAADQLHFLRRRPHQDQPVLQIRQLVLPLRLQRHAEEVGRVLERRQRQEDPRLQLRPGHSS